MDSVSLKPELAAELKAVVTETGKTEAFHIEAALEEYLERRWLEALAVDALKDYDPSQAITHEQMKRELGLEN